MTYEWPVVVYENAVDGWNVKHHLEDGHYDITMFTGRDAEKRAFEYADFLMYGKCVA